MVGEIRTRLAAPYQMPAHYRHENPTIVSKKSVFEKSAPV